MNSRVVGQLQSARYCVAFMLLLWMWGCSGYRTVTLPGENGPATSNKEETLVSRQMNVDIETIDGKTIRGRVEDVSGSYVVIGRVGNYGWETVTLQRCEIVRIRTASTPRGISAITSTAGIISLVAGAGLVLLLAFGEYR